MRRLSEISLDQRSSNEFVATITLRTPELAKALNRTRLGTALTVWALLTIALITFAWHGSFGTTAHGYIILTLAIFALYWGIDTVRRLALQMSRLTLHHLVVAFTPDRVAITTPDGKTIHLTRGGAEVRFASRPHWRGRHEQREERRLGHPVGYELRDAFEVWVESGLDVEPIAAVANEDDARAIVRHLTEANLLVTRGDAHDDVTPNRAEPA
ncbi:MAG: hypothetical protein KJ587_11860 [Alphaproteobacteria bacterium]|nr:hypothetical protein [Alphaproteobacteria bacterium]